MRYRNELPGCATVIAAIAIAVLCATAACADPPAAPEHCPSAADSVRVQVWFYWTTSGLADSSHTTTYPACSLNGSRR